MHYVLKEIVDAYRALNGSIFACYLDASKAFDRVNHRVGLLFEKLVRRGVPARLHCENTDLLVGLLKSTDERQMGENVFKVLQCDYNGVRQGGILSPYLFSIYVDDLSEQLNECKTGCKLMTYLLIILCMQMILSYLHPQQLD